MRNPKCKKCYYWRGLSRSEPSNFACHYMLDNGQSKKCTEDDLVDFKPKKGRRKPKAFKIKNKPPAK